jgi:hypothetical protein
MLAICRDCLWELAIFAPRPTTTSGRSRCLRR